ncbi:MAG: type ISP restriction/modification enzyme [Pseudomonadota bacterium]
MTYIPTLRGFAPKGVCLKNLSCGTGFLWDPAPDYLTDLVKLPFTNQIPGNVEIYLEHGEFFLNTNNNRRATPLQLMSGGKSSQTKTSAYNIFQDFAQSVSDKMSQLTIGQPEDQLRAPFETLMQEVGKLLGLQIISTGEIKLPGRIGKPDYAIHSDRLLAGYVELKASGTGASTRRFSGHNKDQWKRFQTIPNILYTDGNEWGLYRNGELVGKVASLSGNIATEGKKAVEQEDVNPILGLLTDFLQWKPTIPFKSNGKINMKELAVLLAPLCRKLRDDVTDALKDPSSPLVKLAEDWRDLLFPNASDSQFADAYAQTVTFALLLARGEVDGQLELPVAIKALASEHSLLSRALQILTDPNAQKEISASLNLLIRVIGEVPPSTMNADDDPWIYFYEHFLAAYDSKLRKDAGAYYTPVEVVHAQVRLIDSILSEKFGKPLGFADKGVVTLDPAAGTGTYLLGVIEHALAKIEEKQGPGAVAAQATSLANNIYGFELMVGPYAVAELRVSRTLQDKGAVLTKGGTQIYLTDTLESPNTPQMKLPLYLEPIAEQHRRALDVKDNVPVIVCLGNPPYDRHSASDSDKTRTGNWVRWGDDGKGTGAILRSFLDPAIAAGHGVHLKNIYNLYVYFWRWALWKVFEHKTTTNSGIVSFITGSSYLEGDAFSGMREHMRRVADEIYIVDLGGEGRGSRKSANVFAIQTPVAIAIAIRSENHDDNVPAQVYYSEITGDKETKLSTLNSIRNFGDLSWEKAPDNWQTSFRPEGTGTYFLFPELKELLPWQHSGVQFKRTWPISFDQETLRRRWRALLTSGDPPKALRETDARKFNKKYDPLPSYDQEEAISKLPQDAMSPPIERYAYRSFDRQWIFADNRLIDRSRPDLWRVHGASQVYFSTLLNHPLGEGPALTASAYIPDLHHFRGSYGAKEIFPLYRDPEDKEVNILPQLPGMLSKVYGRKVTPEEFWAYAYGVLAHSAFAQTFADELGSRELRLPLTKDPSLFSQASEAGAFLLWLHTYGERYVPDGEHRGQIPSGKARVTNSVSPDSKNYPEDYNYDQNTKVLRVGDGEFSPVEQAVFGFEVSGLKVVKSWLKYRMKKGAGKKSSPLDDIRPTNWTSDNTTELLELLWVLEATLAIYPTQASLLTQIINGPTFTADEFPSAHPSLRKPPPKKGTLL